MQEQNNSNNRPSPQCLKHMITPLDFSRFTRVTQLLFLPTNTYTNKHNGTAQQQSSPPLVFVLSDDNLITILQLPVEQGKSINCILPMREVSGLRSDVKHTYAWVEMCVPKPKHNTKTKSPCRNAHFKDRSVSRQWQITMEKQWEIQRKRQRQSQLGTKQHRLQMKYQQSQPNMRMNAQYPIQHKCKYKQTKKQQIESKQQLDLQQASKQWLVTLVGASFPSLKCTSSTVQQQTVFQLLRLSLSYEQQHQQRYHQQQQKHQKQKQKQKQQQQQKQKQKSLTKQKPILKITIQKIAQQSIPQQLTISTNDTSKINDHEIAIQFQLQHSEKIQNKQQQQQQQLQQQQQYQQQKQQKQKQLYIVPTTTTFLQNLLFGQASHLDQHQHSHQQSEHQHEYQHEYNTYNIIKQKQRKYQSSSNKPKPKQLKAWNTIQSMAYKINQFDFTTINPKPNTLTMNYDHDQRNEIITRKMVGFVLYRNILTTLVQYICNFSKKHKFTTFKIPISGNGNKNNKQCQLISEKLFPFGQLFSWIGNVDSIFFCAKKQPNNGGRNQIDLLYLINRFKLETVHTLQIGPNFSFQVLFVDRHFNSYSIDRMHIFRIVDDFGSERYKQKLDMMESVHIHWARWRNWIVMGCAEDIAVVNIMGELKKKSKEDSIQERHEQVVEQLTDRNYMAM